MPYSLSAQTAFQLAILEAYMHDADSISRLINTLQDDGASLTTTDSLYLIGGKHTVYQRTTWPDSTLASDRKTFDRLSASITSEVPSPSVHLMRLLVGYRESHKDDDHIIDTAVLRLGRYRDELAEPLIYTIEFYNMWRLFYKADYRSALDYLRRSQAWMNKPRLPLRWRISLSNTEAVFLNANRLPDSSLVAYQRTLSLMDEMGQDTMDPGYLVVLNNYAYAVLNAKDYPRALKMYKRLLPKLDCEQMSTNCMFTYIDLSHIYNQLLQFRLSDEFMTRALDHSYDHMDRANPEWLTLYEAAIMHLNQRERHLEADSLYQELEHWAQGVGVYRDRASNYAAILLLGAETDLHLDRGKAALAKVREGERILRKEYFRSTQPDLVYLRDLYPLHTQALIANGAYQEAIRDCMRFDQMAADYDDIKLLRLQMRVEHAKALFMSGRYMEALDQILKTNIEGIGYQDGGANYHVFLTQRWTLAVRAVTASDMKLGDKVSYFTSIIDEADLAINSALVSVMTKHDQYQVYTQYEHLYDELYKAVASCEPTDGVLDALLVAIDHSDVLSFRQSILASSYSLTRSMNRSDSMRYAMALGQVRRLEASSDEGESIDALVDAYQDYSSILESSGHFAQSPFACTEDCAKYPVTDIRAVLNAQDAALLMMKSTEDGIYLHWLTDSAYHQASIALESYTVLEGKPELLDTAGWEKGYETLASHLVHFMTLAPAENIIIMTEPQFLGIPFEALKVGGRMLIERSTVRYIHNLSQLVDHHAAYEVPLTGVAPIFDKDVLSRSEQILPQPNVLMLMQRLSERYDGTFYLRHDASRVTLMKHLSGIAVLQISSHVTLDMDRPMQSHLLLAGTDGTVDRLPYYSLLDADIRSPLTVLHACDASKSLQTAYLGVVSLARTLSHAGCKSLLTSAWDIDEQASSELLSLFYDHLTKAHRPSEALRMAKLSYLARHKGEMVHPYYWSGLIYIGDDRPIDITSSKKGLPYWGIALAILAIGLTASWFNRTRRLV